MPIDNDKCCNTISVFETPQYLVVYWIALKIQEKIDEIQQFSYFFVKVSWSSAGYKS